MYLVNTLVTSMCPCGKPSSVSNRLLAYESSPVLHVKLRTTPCSEQRSREEGGKGTKGYLPAKAADTSESLRLKDGSDLLKAALPPQFIIDGSRSCLGCQEDNKRSRLELRRGHDKGYNQDE